MCLSIKIKPLVLVGASGSGRTALGFRLLCQHPHKFDRVISHTTRLPRQNQLNGLNFHFTNVEAIKKMQENHKFITLALSPHNNYYGLTRQQMQNVIKKNKIPIFRLTLTAFKDQIVNKKLDCHAIYVRCFEYDQLEQRLKHGPFTKEQISQKLQIAKQEDLQVQDYFEEDDIINNDQQMDQSYVKLKSRLFDLY